MKNQVVEVWNNNVYDHEEKFKGQTIRIPAGGFITMNRFEAAEFKSQFKQPIFLKGGVPDPKHFKKIELRKIDDTIEPDKREGSDESLLCQKCGFKAKSASGLKSHVRHNHLQSMEDADARKELSEG